METITQEAATALKPQYLRIGEESEADGGMYAGIVRGEEGQPDYHLFLIASRDNKQFTWEQAMAAAAELGGALPTRREQAILFGNLKDQFQPDWYWSSEQYAPDPCYAWFQYFDDGYQDDFRMSAEGRARAVRRLPI
jgi:hypothetical protein